MCGHTQSAMRDLGTTTGQTDEIDKRWNERERRIRGEGGTTWNRSQGEVR